MKPLEALWGVGFILVGIIGGVICGGILPHQLAPLIAGACFSVIGIIGMINGFTFSATGQGKEITFWTAIGGRPPVIIACIVLVLAAGAAFFIWPVRALPYW